TSHQALGRPAAGVSALWGQAAGVSALWGQAAPPGRNGTSGHRHDFWTSAGAATAFSLSSLWAALVSGHELVQRAGGRNGKSALARSSAAGRLFVAVSRSQRRTQAAEFRPHQC